MPGVRAFLRFFLLAVGGAAFLAPAPRAAAAPEAPPREARLQIGFDGKYKVGAWTPVWLTPPDKTFDPSRFHVTVPDGDGVPTRYSNFITQVPSGAPFPRLGYVRIGRLNGEVEVLWNDGQDDQPPVSTTFTPGPALVSTRRLIVSLADNLGVEAALRLLRGNAETRPVLATVTDADALPDQWFGYEGVDTVVVSATAGSAFARLSPAQHAALETWVRLGGSLVVNLGASDKPPDGLAGPLAKLLPGRWDSLAAMRDGSDLERFLGRASPVQVDARGQAGGLRQVLLADVAGVIDAPQGEVGRERPLIVRAAHGLGLVSVITADLAQPSLAAWADRPRLVNVLLNVEEGNPEGQHEQSWGEAAQLGFTEMTGQLRSALDQFSSVRVAPFSWIAGFAMLYILCLGPLDYLLLRRLGLGVEFTWLSFALLVLVASGAALATARAWKGESVQVNQVDIVDADLATGTVRGTTFAHVFSPHYATYNLNLNAPRWGADGGPEQNTGCLLSWQGLSGTGLGGMDLVRYTPPFEVPYAIGWDQAAPDFNTTQIFGAPILEGGTKSFLGRWWRSAAPQPEARLTAQGSGQLTGQVYNPLPWKIEDPVLVYGGEFYRLGEPLPSGERHAFDSTLLGGGPRSLKYLLNRRHVLDPKENKDVSSRYDPTSVDVQRILEISLLHKAAGGAHYTELTQRYQSFLDASDLLAVDRAVIIGHVRAAATTLQRDRQPLVAAPALAVTFARLVVPVVPPPANPAPSP